MRIKTSLYFWHLEFCFHTVDTEICAYVCLRYGEGENQPLSLHLAAPQTLRDIQAKTFLSVHLAVSRKYQPAGPPPITCLTAVS